MIRKDFTLCGTDFQYILNVDYESTYPGDGCVCGDDYCRCMVINEDDVSIDTSVLTIEKILDLFIEDKVQYNRHLKINQTLDDDITAYAIGRIMSINKMYTRDSYVPEITGGYYGEEMEGIFLDYEIAKKVTEEILFIFQMDTIKEKIEYLLTLEYNKILNSLIDKKWKIIDINVDEIEITNEKHYKNVPKLDFYNDSNYTDIRCVLRETGSIVDNKYKLIDGYHRLKNTNNNTIKCLVAYE